MRGLVRVPAFGSLATAGAIAAGWPIKEACHRQFAAFLGWQSSYMLNLCRAGIHHFLGDQ